MGRRLWLTAAQDPLDRVLSGISCFPSSISEYIFTRASDLLSILYVVHEMIGNLGTFLAMWHSTETDAQLNFDGNAMLLLTFGTRLNSKSLAKAISSLHLNVAADEPKRLIGQQVHVDLSSVGFADFVAIGHLLVVLRAITDAGAAYSIAWPERDLLEGESSLDPDAALRKLMRQSCKLYLDQAGFGDSLAALPQAVKNRRPQVSDFLRLDTRSKPVWAEEAQRLPQRQRKILPYRWVSAQAAQGLTRSTRPGSLETALRDLGLSSEDSAAVGNGILAELLENGAEHSGSETILLGGAIVPHEAYGVRVDDFDDSLEGFLHSARKSASTLIRLVVADVGRGLLELGEAQPVETDAGQVMNQVLGILDRRFPVAVADQEHHGAKGLWKVSRIVRGYRGALLITTAGWTSVRSFVDSTEGRDVIQPAPAFVPGTFVESELLSRPTDTSSLSPDDMWAPGQGPTDGLSTPHCVSVTLRVGGGIEQADEEGIRRTIADLPPQMSVIVAVKTPDGADAPDDIAIGASVRQILTIAAECAHVPIALVFPNINRPLMSVAIEHLNTGPGAQGAQGMRTPVLVLAPENRHFWVGGSLAMRYVLRTLSSSGQAMTVDDLINGLSQVPEGVSIAVRRLCQETELLTNRLNSLSLRLPPHAVAGALALYVAEEMSTHINRGGIGVWDGTFLTPNLMLTSRWCNLDQLLTELRIQGLAGFALANRVTDRLGSFGRMAPRPLILRVGNVPHEMVAALARSLNGHDEYFEMFDDPRLERATRLMDSPAKVFLVADVVSSGRTLTRALAKALGREMVPIGVAVAIDARDPATVRLDRSALQFRSHSVPMVSLANVDIAVSGPPRSMKAIDPVLRMPLHGHSVRPPTLIPQSAYVEALERNGAARLGHIERPANRHYSAYVDPTVLFREQQWEERALARMISKIREAHASAFNADDHNASICVLFPGGTADDLPRVANRLSETLAEDVRLSLSRIICVRRAAYGPNWHLPASFPIPDDVGHVVLLDSATSTGNTIRQLTRLAADRNVRVVTGILLVNGLSHGDASTLQQTVAVRSANRSSVSAGDAVSVQLYSVARTAMSGLDIRDCTICKLRQKYRSLAPLGPMPAKLSVHRDWLLRTLEPRSKETVFEEQATDLFGAHVGQADCVEYLTLRLELREAMVDTLRIRNVDRKLREEAHMPPVRDSIIRLLVAESHWLESPPLWFADSRASLGKLALSVLTNEDALSTEQMLRVQAVILLAMAAPEILAERLLEIVDTNRHHPPVVLQVMLEALCLITGVTLQSHHSMYASTQPLVHNLIRLEARLRNFGHQPVDTTTAISLNQVRYLLSHGRRLLQPVATEPQAAWAALLDHGRSVANHDYDNAMWRVLAAVSLIGRGNPPEDLDGIREDWEACCSFLSLVLLPSIEALSQLLRGAKVMPEMVPADAARWQQVINREGPAILDDLRSRLDSLLTAVAAERRTAATGERRISETAEMPVSSPYTVDGLLEDLEWWDRLFLNPSTAGAILHEAITRCPTDVRRVLRDIFKDVDVLPLEPSGDEAPLHVFCTTRTLRDVFTHIRRNAEERHRVYDDHQSFQISINHDDNKDVVITVWNTGSAPAMTGGGNGLNTLRNDLEAFGGKLTPLANVDKPWTYGIAVTFQRWRIPL